MPGIKPTVRTTNHNNVQVTFFGHEVLCGFFKVILLRCRLLDFMEVSTLQSQALQFRIVRNVISSLITALGYQYTITAPHHLVIVLILMESTYRTPKMSLSAVPMFHVVINFDF